jgi:hypothetical protein
MDPFHPGSLVTQSTAEQAHGAVPATHRFRDGYRDFVAPAPDGLPRPRVLLAFFGLLAIVGIILISLSISGTSSGAFYSQVHSGKDPSLLYGQPEAIRSDEWNVGVPWTISQVQQGLPARNQAFPGGMDVDIPFGLPDRQPAVLMEPHLWGFLFLDAAHGYAWKWWIPALALIAAAFCMILSFVPRRPLLAAGLSIGLFFSPFFQWWYEPASFWPVVWGAATIAAIVWALKSDSRAARIGWAVAVGYLTTVMAIGLYAPFIIPVVYVVLFFGIGQVIAVKRQGMGWRSLILRLVPLAVGGAVGGIAVLLWLRSKSAVVNLFLNTVYPGQRLEGPGGGDLLTISRDLGAAFSQSLKNAGGFLGINASESSTFFLLGAFLIPVTIWLTVRRRRSRAILPWTSLAMIAVLVLILGYLLVPGWEPIAHLLFLDRSTVGRMIIGIGFASFVLIGTVVRDLDDDGTAASRRVSLIGVALYAVVQLGLAGAQFIVQGGARLSADAPLWWLYAALSAAAIYLFARRRVYWGVALFLVVTIASGATVNPVYVGLFDLRTTTASKAIVGLNKANPKSWVGVGGILVSSMLLESGVTGFNGTQGAPSREMWNQVDPAHKYANEWNRLGEVVWTSGHGSPVVTNPQPDVISATFDACSAFAQKHVGYVLSNVRITSPCLQARGSFPSSHLRIYEVKAKS